MRRLFLALAALAALGAPSRARAANILFVADGANDTGVVAALMADGHTVTMRTNDLDLFGSNASFTDAGALGEYDAIFWSASGGGSWLHQSDLVFTNLSDYVASGGRVMVFGADAAVGDARIIQFLGAASASSDFSSPGPIASIDTSVTVGTTDLRGFVPTDGSFSKNCLTGLGPETTELAASGFMPGCAQWALRRLGDGEVAWISNGDSFGSSFSWTNPLSAYNGALRNFAGAADTSTSEPGAPEIAFDRVFAVDEGAEIVLGVTVTDAEGDDVTWSWDLDEDGSFGEAPGEASRTIAAGTTDGNANLRLSVEASDGTHTSVRTRSIRIRNVTPTITSEPPTETSVGANIRYAIVADEPAGALDPLTYTLVTGPMGAAITADGVFVWRPTELDVTRAEERHAVEITVDDGDGGTVTHAWQMTVSPNHAPSAVTLLFPAGGVAVADTTPRLVVSNASDEDVIDTLTYYFELDDEETFAEPLIARGEMVPQTAGYTAYELPLPLAVGHYHWRAWAHDGSAESEPAASHFYVVPDPDVDAGPMPGTDGAIGGDAGPGPEPMPVERGCACSAPGTRARPSLALFCFAALALLAIRRRDPME